jgi:hypothetical protein
MKKIFIISFFFGTSCVGLAQEFSNKKQQPVAYNVPSQTNEKENSKESTSNKKITASKEQMPLKEEEQTSKKGVLISVKKKPE